jgi:hypothetical protein
MVNGPTAVDVPATNTFQVSADVPFALLPVTVALMADVCRRMSRCAPFAQTKPVIEPAEQKVPFRATEFEPAVPLYNQHTTASRVFCPTVCIIIIGGGFL